MPYKDRARKKEHDKVYRKSYYAENKDRLVSRSLIRTKKWRGEHFLEARQYDIQRILGTKQKVMDKYGGKCRFCTAKDIACLTIDHINDDGSEERRNGGGYGIRFYRNLLKIPIRDDLQCLCINCQWRKRAYGPDPSKWPPIDEPTHFILPHRIIQKRVGTSDPTEGK